MNEAMKKIPIGISSCLLGQEVRYDGGHKNNDYIVKTLGEHFAFTPFCPEVDIGLGIPREPVRLVNIDGQIRCVGTKDSSLDVTERLIHSANNQRQWQQHICGYILKKDSPSCGMMRVKVFNNDMPKRAGSGIYAHQLMQNFPHLPVEEEGRLYDPVLRENFIQRVFVYQRWRELQEQGLSAQGISEFHARHKYIYMSHDQDLSRELGRLVAGIANYPLMDFAQIYLTQAMSLLKLPATRKNHVNVLQHIQGYLKQDLDSDDKQELRETIEQYRKGYLPLVVPITLLKHHFRRCPNEYIDNSYYMRPHPEELMLLNSL